MRKVIIIVLLVLGSMAYGYTMDDVMNVVMQTYSQDDLNCDGRYDGIDQATAFLRGCTTEMLNDIEIFQVIWSDGYITLILGLRQIGLPLICGREVTGNPPTFNVTRHKEAIRSGRYKG